MPRGLVVTVAVALIIVIGLTTMGTTVAQRLEATTPPGTSPLEATTTHQQTPDATKDLPPGTSDEGIDNATKLLERHRSQLTDRAYSERFEWDEMSRAVDENGTFLGFEVNSYNQTVTNGSNATLMSLLGEDYTKVDWLTDEITASKHLLPDRSENYSRISYTYSQVGPRANEEDRIRRASVGRLSGHHLQKYLNGVNYAYRGTVVRNNQSLHEFTATGLNESARTPISIGSSSIDRVNVTVLVDKRGIIHTLNASEIHSRENETVTVGTNYSVRNIGGASPTRPDWVTTELPHLDASITANGTVVELSHTGGMPITRGASLYLFGPNQNASTMFLGPLEPGDTWYLYMMRNATDRILISRNERPEANESFAALGGDTVSLSVDRSVTDTSEHGPSIHVDIRNETSAGERRPKRSTPPGASAEGIENATRLIQAHQATLRNTSYAERSQWEDVTRVTTANGTFQGFDVRQHTVTSEKGSNGTEVHIGSENDSSTYWFTDDATVMRTHSRSHGTNSTIYRYTRGEDDVFENGRYLITFSSQLVHPYLRDLDYDLKETTTRNNRTLYTYSSTGINETVEPNLGDTPVRSTTESINATVVVSDRGIIHSFTAEEIHTSQNETVTIEQNYQAEGVGDTNVVAPAWVTEEIAQFNTSLVANESAVALTHIGGMAVSRPPLWYSSPNASNQTVVNGTIVPGDTIYVYLTTDETSNRTLHTSINERPSANDSLVSLSGGNLSVTAYRSIMGAYDTGIQLEVTIHEDSTNATSRNETIGSPAPVSR